VEAADALTCVATTPTVTEGPYWIDEKLFHPTSGPIPRPGLAGGACSMLEGAYVDIWHCDAKGIYSDEGTYNRGGGASQVNTTGQKFLRGYQITDANEQVKFTTIYPGWYSGRTIHIHFRVRTYNTTVLSNFVSQIFFDETVNNTVLAQSSYSRTTGRDTTNASHMVYRVANPEGMLAAVAGDRAAGVAPGAWVSIYGTGLAATTRTLATAHLGQQHDPDLAPRRERAGQREAGVRAIRELDPGQRARAGRYRVTLTNSAGMSNAMATTLQAVSPGLFVASGYVQAVRYPDGVVIEGSASAKAGDILSLYGTGFGAANSAPATGAVFSGAYETSSAVTVTIGGLAAQVLWAGLIGPGLYQINVVVPAVAAGDREVVARVSGTNSQSGAMLKVTA
jgi:hypothetical protein